MTSYATRLQLIFTCTEGSTELRRYIDIEGRPGTDHAFLADRNGTWLINCAAKPVTYFLDMLADARDRTERTIT